MIEREAAMAQAKKIVTDNPEIDKIYDSFHAFPRDEDDEETRRRKAVNPDDYEDVMREILMSYVTSDEGRQRLEAEYTHDELLLIVNYISGARMAVDYEKRLQQFPFQKQRPPDDGTIKGNL